MAEASIPVDLFNPGQVFACLGFMEAADILLGDAEGGFDWSNEADVRFILRAAGDENPVEAALAFLAEAEVVALAPAGAELSAEKWSVQTALIENDTYAFPPPASPATLVTALRLPGRPPLRFDHWGDATSRDNVKFWAGAGGYPGAALLRDALDCVRPAAVGAATDPLNIAAVQSSSFRFDWRRDYVPIDSGFSPNDHNEVAMRGYPITEIFAALGLDAARPQRLSKLHYRYGALGVGFGGALNPPSLLRAALGAAVLPLPSRRFAMRLTWPGQENQARCITDVTEEAAHVEPDAVDA